MKIKKSLFLYEKPNTKENTKKTTISMTSTPKSGKKNALRRRLGPKVLLPSHNGKNFWNGVLTRTKLAQKTKKLEREVKKYKKEKKEMERNSDICVICQEKCLESKENSTPCGHVFHTGCLLGWLKSNNTCPCCRKPLYDKPEVPKQQTIEHIVENVLTMHTNADSENMERVLEIPTGLLYRLGDEIGRLTTEQTLDIDLDWFVFDTEEEEEEEEDDTQEDSAMEDADTVIMDEEEVRELTTAEMMAILNDGAEQLEEEKMADMQEVRHELLNQIENLIGDINDDDSSNMDLDTPSHISEDEEGTMYTPIDIELLTPQTPIPVWRTINLYLPEDSTGFTEWDKYREVLEQLKNRNRFMRAWNGINNTHTEEDAEDIVVMSTGLWV